MTLEEGGEGEEVLNPVREEERVEELFEEASLRGGLKWRRWGILPVLVLYQFMGWGDSFPKEPVVLRGQAADALCSLSDTVKAAWKSGACSFREFAQSCKALVHSSSSGKDLPGFEGSRTRSFDLDRDEEVTIDAPPYVTVDSKAFLAAKGPWFTAGHVESGGCESIARLESGRKIWIIASHDTSSRLIMSIQDFGTLHRLLTHEGDKNETIKQYPGLFYHLALPGDILIQPACMAHCVVTARSVDSTGASIWSLVHGWEGLDLRDQSRGRVVIDRFCFGVGRGYITQWLQEHSLSELVKLLRDDCWRKALAKWKKARLDSAVGSEPGSSRNDNEVVTVSSFFEHKAVLDHLELFLRLGYDLHASLLGIQPKTNTCRKKNRRLANIKSRSGDSSIGAPKLKRLSSDTEDEFPLRV